MALQIIHVVLGKANPERMNGVNKVVNSLATYQTKLGYNVSVWGMTKNPNSSYPERNYKTRLFFEYKNQFKLDPNLIKVASQLEDQIIFHIHGAFIPQFFKLAKKLVKYDLPYVYTPHGGYNTVALERSAFKKKVYIQLFEKYIVSHAKHLHLIGASEIMGAQKVFGDIKYKLIPNGQNLEELKHSHLSIYGKKPLVFGFCGRLDLKTKGLDLLLKGYRKFLDRTGTSCELWLIGDGPDAHKLEELAQNLDLLDHVRFLGAEYGEKKLNTMANMDVFCLTSRNEGLPGVVLEALGLGVPCIVSEETNMGTYITKQNCGVALDQNNATNIAISMLTMEKYLKTGYLRDLKKNAISTINGSFNWFKISQMMIESYVS